MNFVPIHYYSNYVEAHISLGKLQEEGFTCWLKDENLVTINPIWSHAVGGIKLMVEESQSQRAIVLLNDLAQETRKLNPCPSCCSTNVELVSSPRREANWFSALLGFFMVSYAIPVDKVYHCFDCGHEYERLPLKEASPN